MADSLQELTNQQVSITVDLKKYRIRIHKAVLHMLGDPKFIQLLVNPETMTFAVLSVSKEHSGDQTHKVNQKTLKSDSSIEIYSRSLIETLKEVDNSLQDGNTYRVDGNIIPSRSIAVFEMKAIHEV